MKKVYIMRGLPYSWKSDKARELAKEDGRIHSTNDYFMVNGVYRYDVRQLQQAHQENQENFQKSLKEGIPIVICDNCNVRVWEYRVYLDLATIFGYEVEIVCMPHHPALKAFRETNWRNIPQDKFLGMHRNFENFTLAFPASVPSVL